ncbi:hypothetical protein JTE90_027902, partial [Oedothorax gibbosus]
SSTVVSGGQVLHPEEQPLPGRAARCAAPPDVARLARRDRAQGRGARVRDRVGVRDSTSGSASSSKMAGVIGLWS